MDKLAVKYKNTDEYTLLVKDCLSTIKEAVFNSRWTLIEGYWLVGQRIREDSLAKKVGTTELLQALAVDMNKSERILWYALQFYDKYPDINKLPEGKNISWNKIVHKYLPENKKEEDGGTEEGQIVDKKSTCPRCGYSF